MLVNRECMLAYCDRPMHIPHPAMREADVRPASANCVIYGKEVQQMTSSTRVTTANKNLASIRAWTPMPLPSR